MNDLHRILLGVLMNSLWQIPLLYGVAWVSARLLRGASIRLQHKVWVVTLVLCVALPCLSAMGWVRSAIDRYFLHARAISTATTALALEGQSSGAIGGNAASAFVHLSFANVLLALWLTWMISRLVVVLWSCRRINLLAKSATPFEAVAGWEEVRGNGEDGGAIVLVSDELGMPATFGIRRAIVLVPCSVAEQAKEQDLRALISHELAHVARRDFLKNLLQEVLTLPMSYHPALRGVRRRISETREVICDQMAAERTEGPLAYAQSLVRLASLLVEASASSTPALGLLEGQNLENRLMSLLNQNQRLPRLRAALLGVTSLCLFLPSCLVAAAFTFQPSVLAAADLQPYAGTWHWMFKGKPFVTMQLVPAGDHFTGYMTNGSFANDNDGNMIDAKGLPGRSPVVRSFFSGRVLHIVVEDGHDKSMSEWTMTLVSPGSAEFNTADPEAPKRLKSWSAERVSN